MLPFSRSKLYQWPYVYSIFHPDAAKKCCHFPGANYITGLMYVAFLIQMHQDAEISFETLLESNIVKSGIKEKATSLCFSAFT